MVRCMGNGAKASAIDDVYRTEVCTICVPEGLDLNQHLKRHAGLRYIFVLQIVSGFAWLVSRKRVTHTNDEAPIYLIYIDIVSSICC